MTGVKEYKNTSMPLSRITIGSLQDMGYEVDYSLADPFTIADLGVCGSSCPEAQKGLRRNERKMNVNLESEDLDVVLQFAKAELTMLLEEFELTAAACGDCDDEIKTGKVISVLYQDAAGRLHDVHVTWDNVENLQI